jgi:O-antigen ligase
VKGVLFLVVLGTGYLTSQTDLGRRYFRSIYWSYAVLLVVGLIVGWVFPHQYPLLSADEYSGRTRLSVFDTFPGTMGEDMVFLLLLVPLIRAKFGWLSQIFLFLMVVFSGGKTSTAMLCILLAIRFVFGLRRWRSWRTVAVVLGTASVAAFGVLLFLGSGGQGHLFAHLAEAIYGRQVAADAVSFDGRLALWTASLNLLMENAQVLGYGFDGTRAVMLSVASWAGNSHNGYLELALTGGLLGFVFFLIGLLSVAVACFRARFPMRLHATLVIFFILVTDFLGSTFSFPSYFGSLILLWLFYETTANAGKLNQAPGFSSYPLTSSRTWGLSATPTLGTETPAARNCDSMNA